MGEEFNLSPFTFYTESGQVIKGKDFKLEDYYTLEADTSSDRMITISPHHITSLTGTLHNVTYGKEFLKIIEKLGKRRKCIHYIRHSKKKRIRMKYTKMLWGTVNN